MNSDAIARENHERFLSHLEKSKEGVDAVAAWYENRGWEVKRDEQRRAPNRAAWREYADRGDLFVTWRAAGVTKRIEAKRLRVNFSSLADWPYRDFLVCAKHSYDLADPKPSVYFILSADMTHAATVRSSSRPHWIVVKRGDSRYKKVTQEFYVAPFDYVTFMPFGNQK